MEKRTISGGEVIKRLSPIEKRGASLITLKNMEGLFWG